ncbi:four helix bundle protein [Paraferrimonas sp. SM1919]|uniref:four helix bundle protein n=1 Tax=Paraferrimonas sp. SM1919 TaxID=2662263 RepID=UPI0013CF68CE|nr:four helix bundle protein [Paraferrimonas sp. SM1919]
MHYENLLVWQKSIDVCQRIYELMKQNKDFGFKDQICRSAVSVPSNIAEGSERIHNKEKSNFFSIAKGSVGELKTQVIIGLRVGYIDESEADILKAQCELVARMLGALINKYQNS